MSAVMEAHEPSARYQSALQPPLVQHFELIATAPGGVAKLRELILTLAVQGKLVRQDPTEEPAFKLLRRIQKAKRQEDDIAQMVPSEEQPFQLPPGWAWSRFGDYVLELCTGPFGSLIHKGDYVSGGVPLINPSHMVDGRVSHNADVTVSPEMAATLAAYRLSSGDVLLARRGEVGRYALVTELEDGWLCGTGSFFAKLYEGCDRRYFGLQLKDPLFRRFLLGESVGATMTNLNQRILLRAVLGIPPLAEQSRIVTRVEELMRLCDALESKAKLEAAQHAQLVQALLGALTTCATSDELADYWQRVATQFDLLLDRPEAIDALEQTILQLAVRGLLVPQEPKDEPASVLLQKIRAEKDRLIAEGEIKRDKSMLPVNDVEVPFNLPFGWAWARFPELGDFGRGKSKHRPRNDPALFDPPIYPVVQTGEVARAKGVIREFHSKYSEVGLAQSKLWPTGTLCITIAANIADAAVLGFDACFPDSVVGFVPAQSIGRADYFLVFMETAKTHLNEFAPATAQKNINLEILGALLVPLPPLDEMRRIVARVESLRHLCTNLRQRLVASQAKQTTLTKALIESASI